MGPISAGAMNVVAAKGQRVLLPAGAFNRLYVLASAVGGDVPATFAIERRAGAPVRTAVTVQEWTGAIGQWYNRLRDDRMLREVVLPKFDEDQSWTLPGIESQMLATWVPVPQPPVPPGQKAPPENLWVAMGSPKGLDQIRPGFAKRDEIAWVATHRHGPQGNEPYVFGYVFKYAIDLPEGATALVLPADSRVRIFAAAVTGEPAGTVNPAGLLYAPDLGPGPAPLAAARVQGVMK
jgi:alpha-mannosidase